jgi:arsenate reductase
MADVTVWFNGKCSKCRTTQGILQERGVDADYVRYLEQAPSKDELRRVLQLLGADDARAMARTGEPEWKDLGLADASSDEILDAMVEHPILIERPIVIRGDRAVIGRPPENVLALLDDSRGGAAWRSSTASVSTCVDAAERASAPIRA